MRPLRRCQPIAPTSAYGSPCSFDRAHASLSRAISRVGSHQDPLRAAGIKDKCKARGTEQRGDGYGSVPRPGVQPRAHAPIAMASLSWRSSSSVHARRSRWPVVGELAIPGNSPARFSGKGAKALRDHRHARALNKRDISLVASSLCVYTNVNALSYIPLFQTEALEKRSAET
jgi:hypothetical protein